ncbi:MAG: NAD(+) synthase [Clostridiales bacterium]|nr:NAD(+) synthase [Clostridiales bacterium]
MAFNAENVKNDLVKWIRDWFDVNGPGCNAVIGISGGKDSTVVAGLCVEALGKDRVFGVMMPNGVQADIADSERVCEFLGIRSVTINIAGAFDSLMAELKEKMEEVTAQSIQNLPPRLRMSTLYAVSQCINGRVANTCNLSEDWVGYSTRYGDSVGDFSPLSQLTVHEVREIGVALGMPRELVFKVPSDGLCGKTDEDNLGFTYEMLDKYIRTGVCEDEEKKALIDRKHKANLFKLQLMPSFPYQPEE